MLRNEPPWQPLRLFSLVVFDENMPDIITRSLLWGGEADVAAFCSDLVGHGSL